MPHAPAATDVMALVTDNSRAYSVRRVVVSRARQEPVDPSELPPGHKGPPPKEEVWEQVADSDGSKPVSTEAGDILDVYVDLHMPADALGGVDGTLSVKGGAGLIATIPLTAFYAGTDLSTALDFGALARGGTGHQLFEMPHAPAATNVMASVTDNSRAFSVGRVTVRRSVGMRPVDPSELPPGHKGPPPKEEVWEQVADSDGSKPVSTEAGDILDVYVDLHMPTDAVGAVGGTLSVTGAAGPIATVALTAFYAGITATLPGPGVSGAQGGTASVLLTVNSLPGSPDTVVSFGLVGGKFNPGDEEGLSLRTASVHLAGGGSTQVSLIIDIGRQVPVGPRQLRIEAGTPGRGSASVPLALLVTPGSPKVTVLVDHLMVLSGRSFTVPVLINLGSTNGAADLTFTLGPSPVGVSMASQTVSLVANPDWKPGEEETNVDDNGDLRADLSMSVAAGAEKGGDGKPVGTRDVTINWTAHGTGGQFTVPLAIVPSMVTFHEGITTPSGTALGGWVDLGLKSDGTYTFKGHMHDSGADPYSFRVRAVIRTAEGVALALQHSGHTEGTGSNLFGSPARDDNWDEPGPRPDEPELGKVIVARWPDLTTATMSVSKSYEDTGALGTIEDIVKDALSFLVADVLLGTETALVLVLGSELASITKASFAGPGGLVGVAVAAGVVWIWGPGAFVPAIVAGVAAGAVTDALIRHRPLSAAESAFARQVFGDTLPTDSRIILTNMSGLGGRAFTTPNVDGTILVNIGNAFDDPMNAQFPNTYPAKGQLLIHELTHVWQIAQGSFLPGVMCEGIVNQAVKTLGGNPYRYGPPGPPWGGFNLEAQGAIVDQWFGGNRAGGTGRPMDKESPYWGYISNNILLGQT
jgi:hypothetical protein